MSFLDKEMEESGTKTKKSLLKGYNKIQQMINNLPVEDVWVFNFAGINYYVTVPVTANKIHICKATGTTTSDKHALLWESPLQSICGKHLLKSLKLFQLIKSFPIGLKVKKVGEIPWKSQNNFVY